MGMMWDLEREQAAADAERPDLDITQPTPEEGITAMPSPMGPELRGLTGFILHHEVQ